MKYFPVFVILGAALFLLFGFNTTPTMQTLNNDPYRAAWKAIDELEQKGLPKSALQAVQQLYQRASNEQNAPQIIKTLIYRGKYTTQLEEDGLVEAIKLLQAEEQRLSTPTRQVLQSVLAGVYQRYLQNNLYRIQQRSTTTNKQSDDIRTWTATQLYQESARLYLASVQGKKLRRIATSDFAEIVTAGKHTSDLRPSLYDFLIHQAIDFFTDERSYLTLPNYAFQLDEKYGFAKADTFIDYDFTQRDTTSDKYRTIVLLQEVLQFHQKDKSPAAFVDADLKRLKFVYNNANRGTRDSMYLEALTQLQNEHNNIPIVTDVMYQHAQMIYRQGANYQPNPDNINRFAKRTAYNICQDAIALFPNSLGAQNCRALQAQVQQKKLEIRTEQVNIPNRPILGQLEYRNINRVYLKIAPFTNSDQRAFEQLNSQQQIKYLNGLVSQQHWTLDLIDDQTFNATSTEFSIQALPLGRYVLMASDNPTFTNESGAVSYLFHHVSNIGYWHRKNEQQENVFTVVDRTTGVPLQGVAATFFAYEYDRRSNGRTYKQLGEAVSDANGQIVPRTKGNYFEMQLQYQNDLLQVGDRYSSYSYNNKTTKQRQTHFFLDRAIYRPGQTIYFKGIVVEKDEKGIPTILTNEPVEVTFYDVNYQKVKAIQLRSNEYGTVNGSFIAPNTGLLGQMSLSSSVGNTRHFLQIEAYKRPKFELEFQPLPQSYTLGEEVSITGLAQSFAGAKIDAAKVQYRVVRETVFPYRPWYYRGYYPYQREEMEIANGVMQTDAQGNFTIVFPAIGDPTIPTKERPQFNYRITADVTDITGETQSQTTYVRIGTVALHADVQLTDRIDRDTLQVLEISTKSLNGESIPAQGTVTIQALQSPARTFVDRYWSRPDTHLMSRTQFETQFPHYPYTDEDQIQNWKIDATVFEETFNTAVAQTLNVATAKKKWKTGDYVLTLKTKDPNGQPIEVKKYFALYDTKQPTFSSHQVGWQLAKQAIYEPGEQAEIWIGTAEDRLRVLFEVERDQEIIRSEWLDVDQLDVVRLDIAEEDRGNIHLHFSYVNKNRSYHKQQTLVVPWSNKDLNIVYETFRDKLQPGQTEEWQLKIKGNKKEKVAAEMVAAMYDASLDQFAVNDWNLDLYPTNGYAARTWQAKTFGDVNSRLIARNWQPKFKTERRSYSTLNYFNWRMYNRPPRVAMKRYARPSDTMMDASSPVESSEPARSEAVPDENYDTFDPTLETTDRTADKNSDKSPDKSVSLDDIKVRTNLNETVFFFPDLKTDKDGNLLIRFTMNEALTRWKFLGLAHTQDLKIGQTRREIVTQKELMVVPNAPRFFREGDQVEFTAKVNNMTESMMNGTARLELFDAISMRPIDVALQNTTPTLAFTAEAGQSARLSWRIRIPKAITQAVVHRVVAQAGNYTDGEESAVPVLTNRMLVTETQPLPVAANTTKHFTFAGLKNASASNTLQHEKFILEFTSNPAWYAVQSLPYLMEYPHDCIEQTFNRYYANALATTVANQHPKIKQVFEKWKNADVLVSMLSKNEDLKSALLAETPWVLQAQSEETQQKNIGLLFDLNKMAYEQKQALQKIMQRQSSSGGFSWFPQGRDNRYMTQYIVEGLGHLEQLGVQQLRTDNKTANMLRKALTFIDLELRDEYNKLVDRGLDLTKNQLSSTAIHYLYARSFFPDIAVDNDAQKAYQFFATQAEKYWLNNGIYQEGMLALALQRMGKKTVARDIVASLKERSLNKEELGMYWKYDTGYFWHQLPIETHALMIEVFAQVAQDPQAVSDLKVWLLKNKQTTHWKTTKATAAAVYALLMNGDNWLLENAPVQIVLGDEAAGDPEVATYASQIQDAQRTAEAGTGYFRTTWTAGEVDPQMADIRVENPNSSIAWGAAYWQYFEELDQIKSFKNTPLKLNKQLFLQKNTANGSQIEIVTKNTSLVAGDLLKVRIELRVDRAMEYIHLKDMRASGFEPVNVISQYKYQDGLGYYESTGDLATHFFISYLSPGTYVFEYPLRVAHAGDFSNGITTIQSMYAPEFTSHSEGIRVQVGNKD